MDVIHMAGKGKDFTLCNQYGSLRLSLTGEGVNCKKCLKRWGKIPVVAGSYITVEGKMNDIIKFAKDCTKERRNDEKTR